jgi:hypothetical protein
MIFAKAIGVNPTAPETVIRGQKLLIKNNKSNCCISGQAPKLSQ